MFDSYLNTCFLSNIVEPTPSAKKSRLNGPCYFSQHRTSSLETEPRPARSAVSLQCEGEMETISEVEKRVKPSDNIGVSSSAALLLCRGAGECNLDFTNQDVINKWKDVEVCAHHVKELLTEWGTKFHNKHLARERITGVYKNGCSMPDDMCPIHGTKPVEKLKILTIQDSQTILEKHGYLLHPGIRTVQNSLSDYLDIFALTHSEKQSTTLYQSSKVKFYEQTCASSTDILDDTDSKSTPAKILNQLAKYANVDRVCFPQKRFDDLEERTKQKKVCGVRKLTDLIFGIVAPENPDELKKRVLSKYGDREEWSSGSSKDLDSVLEQVRAQFQVAEDRRTKLIVLGLVANSVTLSKIREYIPDLSAYFYTAARKFARRERGSLPPKPAHREYYKPVAVQSFINFITDPTIMIGLPYGTRNVKLSDGTTKSIPDSIRQQTKTEIYNMYESHLEEKNQKEALGLSKSSIFGILDVCAATDRKATNCVDYYVANGMNAFDELQKILDGWLVEGLTADDILKYLKNGLYEGVQYLRTDFRLHVKQFSRIADHCANFALSDPTNPKMARSCSTGQHAHNHDYKCDRCEKLKATLNEIKRFVDIFLADAEDAVQDDPNPSDAGKKLVEKRKEEKALIEQHEKKIFAMKKHFFQERQNIVNSLKDTEALVTLDFAQKYLPTWHREKQSDYFGKKGISYHVAHTTAKIGEKYVQHTFVHIYRDEVPQDSALVVQTIYHIATELKKIGITKISLRSDNAGAYHCASTIHSLHWIMEESGVSIDTYTFSEAQNGKGASDRGASQVKYRAERYVAQGNNIVTPAEFFAAMKKEPALNGFSFHYGNVTIEEGEPAKWKGISSLNYFKIKEDGIQGFRYYGIGQGVHETKANFKPLKGIHDFDESAGFLPTDTTIEEERKAVLGGEVTKFWYYTTCAKESKCVVETDSSSSETDDNVINEAEIGNVFACAEPGCSATFIKPYNLEKHVLRDKHKKSPERFTMRDYGIQLYSENLEQVQTEHTTLIAQDALKKFQETNIKTELSEGWGLPEKQKKNLFTDKSRTFLRKLFDEGLKKRAKPMDPMVAARRMETDLNADGSKLFPVEERLDVEQISGFFSREKLRRAKQRTKRNEPKTNTKEDKDDDGEPNEEEHPDARLIGWKKNEAYMTFADEIFNATIHSGIFDFSKTIV